MITNDPSTPIEAVDVFEDTTVVGRNSEFADMSNPEGLLFGRMIFVCATTRSGRRFLHQVTFETDQREAANTLADRIRRAGVINLAYWGETYEVYGSPAWAVADAEVARIEAGKARGEIALDEDDVRPIAGLNLRNRFPALAS